MEEGGFSYQILEDKTVMITGYSEKESELAVPETIASLAVTGIGEAAFEYDDFDSVILPNSISLIDKNAFHYCEIGDELILPENVVIVKSKLS